MPRPAFAIVLLSVLPFHWARPAVGEQGPAAPGAIQLAVQTRDKEGKPVKESITLATSKTAVVVIDMWDRHWCKTYTERVGNLTPRMNQTLDAVRKLGIQVVFAPSGVVGFCRDYQQRRVMQPLRPQPEPKKIEFSAC